MVILVQIQKGLVCKAKFGSTKAPLPDKILLGYCILVPPTSTAGDVLGQKPLVVCYKTKMWFDLVTSRVDRVELCFARPLQCSVASPSQLQTMHLISSYAEFAILREMSYQLIAKMLGRR